MADERDSAVLLLALSKTCETLAQRVDGNTRHEGGELTSLVEQADTAINAVASHLDKEKPSLPLRDAN